MCPMTKTLKERIEAQIAYLVKHWFAGDETPADDLRALAAEVGELEREPDVFRRMQTQSAVCRASHLEVRNAEMKADNARLRGLLDAVYRMAQPHSGGGYRCMVDLSPEEYAAIEADTGEGEVSTNSEMARAMEEDDRFFEDTTDS